MRRLASSLTLMSMISVVPCAWADTPLKGGPAAFGSAAKSPAPASNSEKLLLLQDQPTKPLPAPAPPTKPANKPAPTTAVEEKKDEKKAVVDYTVKAASIEVAWLQDTMTYPLRLRADAKPGDEFITLSGYVPTNRLREKVVALAKQTAGAVTLHDQILVYPSMALPDMVSVERDQAQLVQMALEKAQPGISLGLNLKVEPNGITTVSGRVDELDDRRKIIRALQAIPGCTAIRYDLRVMSQPTVQLASATVPAPTAMPVKVAAPVSTPVPVVTAKQQAEIAKSQLAITRPQAPVVSAPPVPIAKLAAGAVAPVTERATQPARVATTTSAAVPLPVKAAVPATPSQSLLAPMGREASTDAFPVLPPLNSFDKNEGGAPAFLDPSAKKAVPIKVSTPPTPPKQLAKPVAIPVVVKSGVSAVEASSLSGLFPPGMPCTAVESPCTTTVMLGSPVVMHVTAVQQVQFIEPLVPVKKVVTKPIVISLASYTQAKPATLSVEPVPALIPVMPRLAR